MESATGSAQRRINNLCQQLLVSESDHHHHDDDANTAGPSLTTEQVASGKTEGALDIDGIYEWLSPADIRQYKEEITQVIEANPDMFKFDFERSRHQHRDDVLKAVKFLGQNRCVSLTDLRDNCRRYYSKLEVLNMVDVSIGVKAGVQYNLWGGTVLNLGTERHQHMLEKIQLLEYPGCFMMTELNHGSNVKGIETTATYDRATQEFVINTPHKHAVKWWIGNGRDSIMGSVFAQLYIDGQLYGVHCFIVPLRDPVTMELLPGRQALDCGEKVGLSGVDNFMIQFRDVRIPRENLLNRFGDVLPDGTYRSPLNSINKRFAAVLGELVGGRVGLALGAAMAVQMAVTIATRYVAQRRQFSPSDTAPEVPVLDYQSTLNRLIPIIASAYCLNVNKVALMDKYGNRSIETMGEVHVMAAGFKAYFTAYNMEVQSTLREMTGGHGYSQYNRFGQWRSDLDIWLTFEGDNTVLLQQMAKDLISQYRKEYATNIYTGALKYVGRKAAMMIKERNPLSIARSDRSHLMSHDYLQQALEYRAARLLHTVSSRLRSKLSKYKKDMFRAWNECLDHLLRMTQAHIEMMLFEGFATACKALHGPNKTIVSKLCSLYGLGLINNDQAFFRNHHYIRHHKANAVQKLVTQLCSELKPYALDLVNAFKLSDVLIHAPMGQSKGVFADNTLDYVLNKVNHGAKLLD